MENKNLTTEDKTSYYYSNNQRIPLARESSVYAVKFVTGRDPRDGSLSRPAFRLLNEDSDNIGFIPNYNLQVYKTSTEKINSGPVSNGIELNKEIRNLKSETSVEFATVAYRRDVNVPTQKLDDLMFATLDFAVQFKADVSRQEIDALNARYNVRIVKPLDYAANGFVLKAPESDGEQGPVMLSNIYFESGLTLFAHPDFVQRRHTRSVATKKRSAEALPDPTPVAKKDNSGSGFDAWTITKGSSDIRVAILDDGVDISHPEFGGKVVAQYDFATTTADATPKNTGDNHGTACAGVAVAKGVKAFGAAPGCSLIAVNTPGFLGSVEEGEMFKWVCDQQADIISCSWGPRDGTGAFDPLPDNVRAAINYCVTKGRQGLGIPIFWAAGNGDESVSNDGYASNPDVIAVAASSSKETRSWYSDFGPEVFICAPSNGDRNLGELGIFTVDRRGNDGYNPDKRNGTIHPADLNYTDSFGGTSSATPLAAGISALMLSINPNLHLGDVRQILKDTADQIDRANGAYDNSGHSDWYGYGRINALEAVKGARDFNSGGSNGNTNSQPSIAGPSSMNSSDAPPMFRINKGGRALYAIEIATDTDLFDNANHGGERTTANFFASWQQQMLSVEPYTLPGGIWELLKSSDRLYYRLHVADDNNWSNYASTHGSSAPGFDIAHEDPTEPENADGISITAPGEVGRNNEAPVFRINKGGRKLYAVEISCSAELFDTASHGSERTKDNFYASWEIGMSSATPFEMPEDVWKRLKTGNELYYRVHVADDNSWTNYGVSTSDSDSESAPKIVIISGSRTSKILQGFEEETIQPFILAEAKKEDEALWSAKND
jgi:subtilisin family serine protease